jgi:hypothetical protein
MIKSDIITHFEISELVNSLIIKHDINIVFVYAG